jgi:hypothetical protein
MVSLTLRGSGTLLVKDEFIFLTSHLFQAQVKGVGELIEDLITRSVPDPLRGRNFAHYAGEDSTVR